MRQAGTSGGSGIRAAVRPLSFAMCALQLLYVLPVHAETPREELLGHYYLSGVMEVGSELLLLPDGTYRWALAYGAVDQAHEGSWVSSGKTVTLTQQVPSLEGVSFRLGERAKWGERSAFSLPSNGT